MCVCVCVCVSFQNSHAKSMTEILKKDFRRDFQKLTMHNIPLTFPASKRQRFVGKICLRNLIFLCHFSFYHLHSSQMQKGEDNLEYEVYLFRITRPSFSPSCATNVLFNVRNTASCAPCLGFPTVTWELHFFLSRKWWEDKSVEDCEMLKHYDLEMNVRQICKQKASQIPFHGFYSGPYLTNKYPIHSPKGGHASPDFWVGL